MTFADNKKRFSYTFMSGSPGIMRAKIHQFVETKGLPIDDKKAIKEVKDQVRTIIYHQLLRYKR
jgi:1-acyl-sn-glycerol-3-phosphate acyltransferase